MQECPTGRAAAAAFIVVPRVLLRLAVRDHVQLASVMFACVFPDPQVFVLFTAPIEAFKCID
jgi:hypothetical protein